MPEPAGFNHPVVLDVKARFSTDPNRRVWQDWCDNRPNMLRGTPGAGFFFPTSSVQFLQIRCCWMLCNFERIYEILLKIHLVVFELSPREVDFATGLSSKTRRRVIG